MEVTAAADIYSIGVILFEMLCGRVPFDGENAVAIAMKQVGEEPPVPSSITPEVTPALDAVLRRWPRIPPSASSRPRRCRRPSTPPRRSRRSLRR